MRRGEAMSHADGLPPPPGASFAVMTLPFTLPDWVPWWVPLVVMIPALLYALAFLFMPFSVIGLKGADGRAGGQAGRNPTTSSACSSCGCRRWVGMSITTRSTIPRRRRSRCAVRRW